MSSTRVITSKRLIQTTSDTELVMLSENSTVGTTQNLTVRWTPTSFQQSVAATMLVGRIGIGDSEFPLNATVLGADPGGTLEVEGVILQPGQGLYTRGNAYSVRVEGFEHTHTGADIYFGSVALGDRRNNNSGFVKIFTTPVDKGAELDEFLIGNSTATPTSVSISIIDKVTAAETVLVPTRYINGNMLRTRRIPVPPNCDVYVRYTMYYMAYYQWYLSPMEKRVY